MPSKSPFCIISEFCSREKKAKTIERILFHNFNEELNELIESYRKANDNQEPSSETVDGFKVTLLSETNLKKNIRMAEEELEDVLESKIKKMKRKFINTNFWHSVFASVLASFIFVILLILVYIVAENQVRSMLESKPKTESVQQENSNPGN